MLDIYDAMVKELRNEGGLTIWTNMKRQMNGYVVAVKQHERTVHYRDPDIKLVLQDYFVSHIQHGHAIGLWLDERTGLVHMDVCLHYNHRNVAMYNAELQNQIAVWDLTNQQEIRLNEAHLIP